MTPSASPAILDDLEAVLRRYMADGITLTGDVRGFMTATFGDASADTLQTLLSDESNAERDSLLDLVFFPDQALQLAIEPVLECHRLTEEAVRLLASRLKAAPVATGLRLTGGADARTDRDAGVSSRHVPGPVESCLAAGGSLKRADDPSGYSPPFADP